MPVGEIYDLISVALIRDGVLEFAKTADEESDEFFSLLELA